MSTVVRSNQFNNADRKPFTDTNSCTFTGRLGIDPELRSSHNRKPVTSYVVYITDRWTDATGIQERVTRIPVVQFGAGGQEFAQSATKGDRVRVTGKLQEQHWRTPDGQKRTKLELVAFRAEVLRKAAGIRHAGPAPDHTEEPNGGHTIGEEWCEA